jgi:hypothetical protein
MHVFVSHDSHDDAFAEELRQNLTKLGLKVWNPSVELFPGSNWLLETGRALERADAVVFVVSPHSARSRWSHFEMQYALTRKRLQDRVIPVVLGQRAHVPWIMRGFSISGVNRDASEIAQTIATRLMKKPGLSREARSSRKAPKSKLARVPSRRSAKSARSR